jgi:hypothetical protein
MHQLCNSVPTHVNVSDGNDNLSEDRHDSGYVRTAQRAVQVAFNQCVGAGAAKSGMATWHQSNIRTVVYATNVADIVVVNCVLDVGNLVLI